MVIYLDMDGVLADFFGGLAKRFKVKHWKDIPDIDDALAQLKDTSFFGFLDLFDTTYPIVGYIKELTYDKDFSHLDWGICSTPLRNDRDNSAYWKRKWLEKHNLMPDKIPYLVFTHKKETYATHTVDGTPNILVDDKYTNIKRWTEAGGLGILWQANRDGQAKLESELHKAIKLGSKV
jgi:hypothetical protein